jgi:hypothetical protein
MINRTNMYYFDESNIDVDIAILKYLLQFLTPKLY